MASKRRDRERKPARKPPKLEPKRRLLVVCEGEVTEREYLQGYERWAKNATVRVEVADERGDPKKVVEIAKDLAEKASTEARKKDDEFIAFDEVWCVFDRDEHDSNRFHGAIQMAQANGFQLAVSNPCFELWLLLHFRASPGMRHRHEVQRMVSGFVPGFEKHVRFEDYASGVGRAATRARRLDEDASAMNEFFRNPTTGVYGLTDSISRKDPVDGTGEADGGPKEDDEG